MLRVARPPITPEHAPPLTRGTSSLDDRGAPPRSASDAGLPVAADACPPVVPDARGTAVSSRPGQAVTQGPPAVAGTSPGVPDVVTQGAPQAHLSPEDLVEVVGPFPGEPLLVRRAWLTGLERAAAVRGARCHASTGALLDDSGRTNAAYRPSARLTGVVRIRDGRCRFPGCSVAARFCDLDHVRPWPTGPTSAANLMCLCRRHHRIKQRPGWSVRLHPDARAVWTDPTGRVRTSWPRDLLDVVVLPAGRPASATVEATREATTSPEPVATGGAVLPSRVGLPSCDGGATALEVLLGVLVDHCPVPAVRAQAEVGTVVHGQPAMAGETTPTRARRPEVRVQVVRPDPRCRAVRYVDERPLHVGRSRSGACVTRPRHTAGAGPPPF